MTTVCGSRLVFYVSGLKTLLHRVAATRALSAAASNTVSSSSEKATVRPREAVPSRAPDRALEPLSLLPPHTAMSAHLEALASINRVNSNAAAAPPTDDSSVEQLDDREHRERVGFDAASVECVVQPCPHRLSADAALMFPLAPPTALTVVTVTQRTEQDMSFWSSAVEEERERLLQSFIQEATQICEELWGQGHWADFIEPSSGLPFFGPYTNLPLFETDERMSSLGFTVEDLGCCRVLRHSLWGTNVFVGVVFTSAPAREGGVIGALQGSCTEG